MLFAAFPYLGDKSLRSLYMPVTINFNVLNLYLSPVNGIKKDYTPSETVMPDNDKSSEPGATYCSQIWGRRDSILHLEYLRNSLDSESAAIGNRTVGIGLGKAN
ncbi:unnamed protein product [Fusarium fujikuroi]|nr:unnamed protein product [Fusarium fujikuroi]